MKGINSSSITMSEKEPTLVKVEGNDFHLWKFQAQIVLESRGLWGVVSGEEQRPASASFALLPDGEWLKRDSKAKALLVTSLGMGQINHVTNCGSSKEIWDRLCSVYERQSSSYKNLQIQEFYTFGFDQDKAMVDNLSSLETLLSRARGAGATSIDDDAWWQRFFLAYPPLILESFVAGKPLQIL
jgi:hypothetical protein